MADIKVERKPAVAWWAWLLLALALLALIWWLVARLSGGDERTAAAPAAPAAVSAEAAPAAGTGEPAAGGAGGAVTELTTLLTASSPGALAGRAVELDEVPVQDMVGDAAFWIGGGAEQRVLVVLDQQIPSPPANVEGRVNVNAGQTVAIRGRVRAAGDPPTGAPLEARESEALRGQQIYIWAEAAEVVTPAWAAPSGPPGRR